MGNLTCRFDMTQRVKYEWRILPGLSELDRTWTETGPVHIDSYGNIRDGYLFQADTLSWVKKKADGQIVEIRELGDPLLISLSHLQS